MVFKHLRSKLIVLVKMFSTLVLYFSTCNNLVNNGNQQERLVDNSNSISAFPPDGIPGGNFQLDVVPSRKPERPKSIG